MLGKIRSAAQFLRGQISARGTQVHTCMVHADDERKRAACAACAARAASAAHTNRAAQAFGNHQTSSSASELELPLGLVKLEPFGGNLQVVAVAVGLQYEGFHL
mmetsp:Transcript_4618/g.5766  ORF Transcript_4618/g.5766 Transcript_4618/m.5766 type:complete len:104 (-) Transcript_4618:194-505(-)